MHKNALFSAIVFSSLAASGTLAQDLQSVQVGSAQKEFPESITSTSDGTLYAGSMTLGVIYKAAPGATAAEPFIAAQAEGPPGISGVFADEANETLWACYVDLAAFGGGASKPSMLRSFDLATGAGKASYSFAGPSFCNDIATTADGTAYATDTIGGSVLRAAPGATELEEWLKSDSLAGIDGLSFAPDGKLYANSVTAHKLMRIDIGADGSAGAVTDLTLSQEIKGPDGMRFGGDGVLYLAENANGRVDAVSIQGDAATITPLAGAAFDFPTAVTKVGSTLWVLESQLGKMGGDVDPGAIMVRPITLQ
jgi:sugar lactone lactonase YvrE